MVKTQPFPLKLGSQTFETGRHLWNIPVTTDLNGGDIRLCNHVVAGARPGPTLTLTSTLHGLEWQSIEMIRRVVERIDPQQLSGAVIALPVANPSALGAMSRSTPDNSDNADLNRVFPGQHSWITEQLASTITREILPHTSALIDFHLGIWGCSFGYVVYGKDYPNPEVSEASKAMAVAFDLPIVKAANVISTFPGPRSMIGYAGAKLGIPSCIGELGGTGFDHDTEEEWIESCVSGMLNVMRLHGMYPGELPAPRRHLSFEFSERVNPKFGGMLHPVNPRETFGREVSEGELLARVISPYTFEVLEELRSPCDGYLSYFARFYPVRPGDWGFGVIRKDHPATRWIEP